MTIDINLSGGEPFSIQPPKRQRVQN